MCAYVVLLCSSQLTDCLLWSAYVVYECFSVRVSVSVCCWRGASRSSSDAVTLVLQSYRHDILWSLSSCVATHRVPNTVVVPLSHAPVWQEWPRRCETDAKLCVLAVLSHISGTHAFSPMHAATVRCFSCEECSNEWQNSSDLELYSKWHHVKP